MLVINVKMWKIIIKISKIEHLSFVKKNKITQHSRESNKEVQHQNFPKCDTADIVLGLAKYVYMQRANQS